MGLSIFTKTGENIHWSYTTIHRTVRWLALIYCGMPYNLGKNFQGENIDSMAFYMYGNAKPGDIYDSKKMLEFIWAVQLSGKYFPNILFHSDCEGGYTKNGKCDPENDDELFGGNSIQLLKELKKIYEAYKNDNFKGQECEINKLKNAFKYFKDFYFLVKKEVEEGKGTIRFH